MSASKSDSAAAGPATISLCEIVEVNHAQYTVTVDTEFTNKTGIPDIPVASPYAHPQHGGGTFIMPEVGSLCYLFESADGTRFVSAFVMSSTAETKPEYDPETGVKTNTGDIIPDYSGRRPLMEAGDAVIGTKDGNFISVKRGGVIQIAANGLCQRILIPIENLIRDYFMKYEARSPLGEVIWGHQTLSAPGEEQKTGVLIQGSWREHAQDTDFAVEVRCGKLSDALLDPEVDSEHLFADGKQKDGLGILAVDNIGALSITVAARDGGAVTYKKQVTREGDVFSVVAGDVHVELGSSFYASIATQGRVEFGTSTVDLDALTNLLKVKVDQMVFERLSALVVSTASLALTVGATSINVGPGAATISGAAVNVGGVGGNFVLTNRNDLLAALTNHVHLYTDPTGAILPTQTSVTLAAIATAVSTTLKST